MGTIVVSKFDDTLIKTSPEKQTLAGKLGVQPGAAGDEAPQRQEVDAAIAASRAAHEAEPDPHPQYATPAEAAAAAPVQSVNGQTGAVTLNAASVGADPAGSAAAALASAQAYADDYAKRLYLASALGI